MTTKVYVDGRVVDSNLKEHFIIQLMFVLFLFCGAAAPRGPGPPHS